jgi:hypothetical protein
MSMNHIFLYGLLLALAQSQPPVRILDPTNPNPSPSEVRMATLNMPTGASWRVFGVDSFPGGPVQIVEVAEVRQQNPPSTWAVYVSNRDLRPLNSFTIAAAVVDVKGNVKATQVLPAIKNLKPQQVNRKEIPIRVTVIAPTDRVVFYLKEVKSETGDWTSVDADVAALIKATALKLPVP